MYGTIQHFLSVADQVVAVIVPYHQKYTYVPSKGAAHTSQSDKASCIGFCHLCGSCEGHSM